MLRRERDTRGPWLVDLVNAARNDLLVVSQFTVKCAAAPAGPTSGSFLIACPCSFIELKDPTDEQADVWKAYRQLQDYEQHIRPCFITTKC